MTLKLEERARWQTPRPGFVRESEPLAHDGAWPSVDPIHTVDPAEQKLNRDLFRQGLSRKKAVANGQLPAAGEKKAG